MAWNCLFMSTFIKGVLWRIPKWCPNPKRNFLVRKHAVCTIVHENWSKVRPSCTIENNRRTGQSMKVTKLYLTHLGSTVIFHPFGQKPPVNRLHQNCMGAVRDAITCAKFRTEIIRATISFSIFLLIFTLALQQCSIHTVHVIKRHMWHEPNMVNMCPHYSLYLTTSSSQCVYVQWPAFCSNQHCRRSSTNRWQSATACCWCLRNKVQKTDAVSICNMKTMLFSLVKSVETFVHTTITQLLIFLAQNFFPKILRHFLSQISP